MTTAQDALRAAINFLNDEYYDPLEAAEAGDPLPVHVRPIRDGLLSLLFPERTATPAEPDAMALAEKLANALATIASFRGQLTPENYGGRDNFATALAIADEALFDFAAAKERKS